MFFTPFAIGIIVLVFAFYMLFFYKKKFRRNKLGDATTSEDMKQPGTPDSHLKE